MFERARAMRLRCSPSQHHRARKRGWITTSTSAAELSVSMGDNTQRETVSMAVS
jgi:hypothetical protein